MENSYNRDDLSNPILPEDLIFNEIMLKLPVKTLIRFKSVCKLWQSIISSYKFATTHLNFSSASAHHFILYNYRTSTLNYFPYDEFNNINANEMNSVDISRFETEHRSVTKLRVCDGLILWVFRDGSNTNIKSDIIAIFNPASHKYCEIAIPDSQQQYFTTCTIWFGYVPSIDDYRIVAEFLRNDDIYDLSTYHVYSLRTGMWKLIPDLDSALLITEIVKDITTQLFDDLLYWSPSHTSPEPRPPKRIIAFNLVTEKVKEFPSMDWLSAYIDTQFFVLNGCLSLYCNFEDPFSPVSDVWMLKRHDDWSSWEMSFSVHHGGLYLDNVSPTGKFLVFRPDDSQQTYEYKIIDASNGTQQQLQGDSCFLRVDIVGGGGSCFYGESLIWPFGISESVEEDSIM